MGGEAVYDSEDLSGCNACSLCFRGLEAYDQRLQPLLRCLRSLPRGGDHRPDLQAYHQKDLLWYVCTDACLPLFPFLMQVSDRLF